MDFLDRRGIKEAAVGGNSLGGGLALLLAWDYPARIPALILLAPAAVLTKIPYLFYPLRLPVLGLLTASLLGPWIIPWALRVAYHRRELITPEVVAGYALPFRDWRHRLALWRLVRHLRLWPLTQVEALLQAIRQPAVLIWGAQDRILPAAQAPWIKARLPQARLNLLPEIGHAPMKKPRRR